jgi:Flp pilus assembly protein TadD
MQKFIQKVVLVAFALSLSTAAFSADQSQIILNLKSASLQVSQAEETFKAGQFNEAMNMVSRLKPMLSEFTELHSQLYDSIKDDAAATITSENEKKQTIEFAKLRDRINYLAGMVSMKQGNNREAVKHFVQVVQSQRTTGLGEKAYSALRDLGFSPKLTITDQI